MQISCFASAAFCIAMLEAYGILERNCKMRILKSSSGVLDTSSINFKFKTVHNHLYTAFLVNLGELLRNKPHQFSLRLAQA